MNITQCLASIARGPTTVDQALIEEVVAGPQSCTETFGEISRLRDLNKRAQPHHRIRGIVLSEHWRLYFWDREVLLGMEFQHFGTCVHVRIYDGRDFEGVFQ